MAVIEFLLPLCGLALVLLVILLVTVHLCHKGMQKEVQQLLERFSLAIRENEAHGIVLRAPHTTPVSEDASGTGTSSAVYERVDDIVDYLTEDAHYNMDSNECYISRPANI